MGELKANPPGKFRSSRQQSGRARPMQQDGRQVWPPSGSFSVSSGNEVPMNLKLALRRRDSTLRFNIAMKPQATYHTKKAK